MNYYEKNANKYLDETIECDMSIQYEFFLKYLQAHSTILDLGFGSGRDMMYFDSIGHKVIGIDPCESFVKIMSDQGYEVYLNKAEDIQFDNKFDGIWACASLLHVKSNYMNKALKNCSKALKKTGVLYASFKYGEFEGERKERYFVDMNEKKIKSFIVNTGLSIIEMTITSDVREGREDDLWLNLIFKKE